MCFFKEGRSSKELELEGVLGPRGGVGLGRGAHVIKGGPIEGPGGPPREVWKDDRI